MQCCYAGEEVDRQVLYVPCTSRPDIIESERDGNRDPPIQCAEVSSLGRKSKRCSSSTRPESSAQDYRHEPRDALQPRVLGRAVRRRHYCWSSRCCSGLDEDAPTHGKSCGSDRKRGATRLLGGTVRAHQDGLAWTSLARRRCPRISCSDGGD